jgi:hypothetical protein
MNLVEQKKWRVENDKRPIGSPPFP